MSEINKTFNLKTPLLMRKPLGFFLRQLRVLLPQGSDEEGGNEDPIYPFDKVIKEVEEGIRIICMQEKEEPQEKGDPLEKFRDAVRRSQHKEALLQARTIALDDLGQEQRLDFLEILDVLASEMSNPQDKLDANSLFMEISKKLIERAERPQ